MQSFSFEYISLGALKLDIYERLPLPIRGWIRRSALWTLITNLVSLPILIAVPNELLYSRATGYIVFEDVVQGLINLSASLYPYFIILNVINLLITMGLLTYTIGTLRGGGTPVQGLIVANGVPAVTSVIVTCSIITVYLIIFIINLIIILIIISIIISAIFAWLSGNTGSK